MKTAAHCKMCYNPIAVLGISSVFGFALTVEVFGTLFCWF